jgi:hypothetical protein
MREDNRPFIVVFYYGDNSNVAHQPFAIAGPTRKGSLSLRKRDDVFG